MSSVDQIIKIALAYSEQNITEIQKNQGWTDQAYQADMVSIGWTPGDEWCAASIKLTWKKAYADKPDVWKHAKPLLSLNSQQTATNFHKDPVWPTSVKTPKPGAIVVWQDGNSLTSGHCGIIVAINGNKFTSIEGNTTSRDKPDNKEGWTVAAHEHTVGAPHALTGLNFVRFVYAIEGYDPLEII